MLFIIPDFLKGSTPAVSSKFFHPPPPRRHVGQKKFPWRHPSVSTPLDRGQRPIKIGLLFTPHCMIKHVLK